LISDVDINQQGEIFALAYRTIPDASQPTNPTASPKGQAFMLFNASGTLLKADYYDFSVSTAYKFHGFHKARLVPTEGRLL
jgi:hypothetical protein